MINLMFDGPYLSCPEEFPLGIHPIKDVYLVALSPSEVKAYSTALGYKDVFLCNKCWQKVMANVMSHAGNDVPGTFPADFRMKIA